MLEKPVQIFAVCSLFILLKNVPAEPTETIKMTYSAAAGPSQKAFNYSNYPRIESTLVLDFQSLRGLTRSLLRVSGVSRSASASYTARARRAPKARL